VELVSIKALQLRRRQEAKEGKQVRERNERRGKKGEKKGKGALLQGRGDERKQKAATRSKKEQFLKPDSANRK
jgi:hypothetical protein